MEVTSVTTDDDGDVSVVYVVQNVDPEDVEEMQEQLESSDMADAIGDNLQDAGFDGADVETADSAPATVEVVEEPVIEAQQEIAGGVTLEQAEGEVFQEAFEGAVAEQLGVDPEDVDITSVETDDKGAVIVTYQVSDVDPLDQIAVEKAVESDAMADVIADNLQDVGFDNADVEAADAEITTAEVIEMPEPSPPAPEQVIVAQQEFQGVNPDQAESKEFQEAVEQAVADQLDVDVEDVEVTSVNTNEKGDVTVVYVVQNVDPEDVEEMQEQLESGDMADAIGDNLQDAGFDGANVQDADVGVATVEVVEEPVIEASQVVNGVTLEQAQTDEFQDAAKEAVVEELKVPAEDVTITAVTEDEDGHVVFTYQVADVDPLEQIAVQKAAESDAMADGISDTLQEAGFEGADVETADAQITTVEVIDMPDGDESEVQKVVEVQQEIAGVSEKDANTDEFQAAVADAVADQLNVDTDDVTITSVTTSEEGNVVITYVVANMDTSDLGDAEDAAESRDMAAAIGDNLHDAGFDDAAVAPADAEVATMEITETPVVEATQTISGVTLEQAQGELFQEAVEAAVADRVGVDAEDVDITEVTVNDEGQIDITYQISGVDPLDQIAMEKTVESEGVANDIADNLQEAGFDNVEVAPADAEITTAEVIATPDTMDAQVVEVSQEISGVTEEQAQSDEFQTAVADAVIAQLGVFPDDVIFKPFIYDPEDNTVTVSYVVVNVDEEDLSAVQASAESQGTASAIGTNLRAIGYDSATPKRAEAAVRNNTPSQHPRNRPS